MLLEPLIDSKVKIKSKLVHRSLSDGAVHLVSSEAETLCHI